MKASALLLWIAAGSLLGLLLLGILAFASVGDGSSESGRRTQAPVATDAREFTVEVFDDGFAPDHLTVRPGTRITWNFVGKLPHTVTEPGGLFDSGPRRTGEQWSMTFDQLGEYFYLCSLHHSMQARVIVQP